MRLRFWIGLAAVLLIAVGSVAAALIVRADDDADFHEGQRGGDAGGAPGESVASLSIGQLASAAAFFQAEGTFTEHEFDIVAEPLLRRGALSGTAFIQRVPDAERVAFERRHGARSSNPAPTARDGPARGRSTSPSSTPSAAWGASPRSATTSAPTPNARPSCAAPATVAGRWQRRR